MDKEQKPLLNGFSSLNNNNYSSDNFTQQLCFKDVSCQSHTSEHTLPQLEYPSFHNIIQCPNLSINFDQDESLQCFRKIKVNEINANLSHHTKYKIIKLKEFSHPLASSSFSDKVTLSTSYCILYIVYYVILTVCTLTIHQTTT